MRYILNLEPFLNAGLPNEALNALWMDSLQRLAKQSRVTLTFQEEPSWEDLLAYRVLVYPHELIVLTNATPDQMDRIVNLWAISPDGHGTTNIEDFIRSQGYYALTGQIPVAKNESHFKYTQIITYEI